MNGPPGGVLVIQTAFLGDVVLSTGLLHELAGRLGPVDVVTTPAAATLLAGHPAVRRVLPYDKRGRDRGPSGFLAMAAQLRRAGYRQAWVPHRSLRSALLARLSGIPERIGFAGGLAGRLHTRRVPRPAAGHEAERLLALAEPGPGARARVGLGLGEDDRAAAGEWLERHRIPGGFIAVAPGSIWGTKRWPGYAELAARLGGHVVVVGGPEDAPLGSAIAAVAPDRVAVAAGELSLRASAALIERAALLVTNDSAPLHLATAVGTPIVAIFGPTVPAFGFGPRAAGDRVVEVPGLACRPCSPHGPKVCPLGHHRCMKELGVEQVLAAVAGIATDRPRAEG